MVYQNNCLCINEQEIKFESKIYNVMETKSYIFVLLGFEFDTDTHCNIYCFNKEGQKLWQIKKRDIPNDMKNMNNAYIGLRIVNGRYSAVNFYNEEVAFNPFNGKII